LNFCDKDTEVKIWYCIDIQALLHTALNKIGNYPMKRAANDNNIARISDNNSLNGDNNSNNSVQRILVKKNKKNHDNGLIFYIVDQSRRQIIIPSDKWTDNF
jgi:hypothetical protein